METYSRAHLSHMATLVERISSIHWFRHKWFSKEKNLKEDDVVIVIDPNARRRDWKVGRIVHTYPGADGLVHVVDIKVSDKILKRPITKLSPLEMQD